MREHIEAARKTQAGTAERDSKAGSRVSGASLAAVRAERKELQEKLSDAEDTVGVLRRSLKQMMRDHSA